MRIQEKEILTFLLSKLRFLRLLFFLLSLFCFLAVVRFINTYFGVKWFLMNYRYFYRTTFAKRSASSIDQFIGSTYAYFIRAIIKKYFLYGNSIFPSYLRTKESRAYRNYFRGLPREHLLRLRYPSNR